jgi:hypothetical protein
MWHGGHVLRPSLLFNWRRLMLEGGLQAVQADEDVVGTRPPIWRIDKPLSKDRSVAAYIAPEQVMVAVPLKSRCPDTDQPGNAP